MTLEEIKKLVDEKSFFKTSLDQTFSKRSDLTDSQKVQLNRRGNELFNQREYEKAKQIYLLTGYSDGLARIGDFYISEKNEVEALKMYVLSKMSSKIEPLAKKAAGAIRELLQKEDSFHG